MYMMKMKVILFLSILVFVSFKESQCHSLFHSLWHSSFNSDLIGDHMANIKNITNGNINENFDKSIKIRTVK